MTLFYYKVEKKGVHYYPTNGLGIKQLFSFFLMLIVCGVSLAQECSQIKARVLQALHEDQLKEALNQIKAFRACDASLQGKETADTWTEQVFQRIKDLEQRLFEAKNKLEQNTNVAAEKKRQAQQELTLLEKEKNTASLAQQTLESESKQAQVALEGRKKAQELNGLLISLNVTHLQVQQLFLAKKYEDALNLLEKMKWVLTSAAFEDEILDLKKTLVEQDLTKARTLLKQQEYFKTYLQRGDSILDLEFVHYYNAYGWYQKAWSLQIDSLAVLEKYAQLENLISSKTFKQIEPSFYDSLLLASMEMNTYLNRPKAIQQRIRRFLWSSPQVNYNFSNVATNSYVADYSKRLLQKLELGIGIKTVYTNALLRENKILARYKDDRVSVDNYYWYWPISFHLNYHLNIKNVINLVVTTGKSYSAIERQFKNINLNSGEASLSGNISILYAHEFWASQSDNFLGISGQWLLGVSYSRNNFAPSLSGNFDTGSNLDLVTFPDVGTTGIRFYLIEPKGKIYFSDNYYSYVNIIAGLKFEKSLNRSPVRAFMVLDYNYTLGGNKSRSITSNPGEWYYADFLSNYGNFISNQFKQRLYNYYLSCDCEITFERNPRRYAGGFTFSLGLAYRF